MNSPIFYKPRTLKRVLWAILITLLALGIIFLANYLTASYFSSRKAEVPSTDKPNITPISFTLDPGVSYKNAVSDSMLYFYSAENIKITDKTGALLKDFTLHLSQPEVALRGDYALFYEPGGKNAYLFHGDKQVKELNLNSGIYLASVNTSGYMLIVSEGDSHKCAVSVYSPDAKEIFKWNSGGLSVVAADISDNNRDITVSAINTDEGTIKNSIIMFNIAKEKPFTNDMYEGELYALVRYSGGYAYCIGSTGTRIYNGYGKCVGTASYSDRSLIRYTLEGDLLVLAFSGSSSEAGLYEIKSFNTRGEETGSFITHREIDFLVSKNGNIILNNGRTLSVLNNRCREKFQINLGFDIRDFYFISDSRHGIGITATGAEIIELSL